MAHGCNIIVFSRQATDFPQHVNQLAGCQENILEWTVRKEKKGAWLLRLNSEIEKKKIENSATHKPLSTVHYNTIVDIKQFIDKSQTSVFQTKMYINGKLVVFYIII